MFRKRRTYNDEQTTTAGRDYHEIEVLMGQVMARLDAIKLMHISPVKQIAKLQKTIERLSRGEIVQNRQLKNVLGTEGYARYLSDCEYQKYLRTTLKNKPPEITEYERRQKSATFAYSKADNFSQKGVRTARKMFNVSVCTPSGKCILKLVSCSRTSKWATR